MVDVLFKFIFGAEERKHVTLDFLNAVLSLEDEQELKDIHFLDRELVPESDEAKLSRLDIYGVTDDGSQVDIEVQIVNRKNMEKRTLYYWSRMYQSLERGEEYIDLHRAITINVLDFNLLPQNDPHACYGVYNMETGHRLTDNLEIHFLEVPKWQVKSIKEMKRLDRWLGYLSKKLNDEEREVLAMEEKSIRDAMEAEKFFTQDDIKRWEYEHREDALRDYRSDMRASREEGRAEGRLEGRLEGRVEGKEEGKLEGVKATALEMLKNEIDIDLIVKCTKMSTGEIHELAKQLKMQV
jgi:predicted transposase/invertase (TIGR01784 family)